MRLNLQHVRGPTERSAAQRTLRVEEVAGEVRLRRGRPAHIQFKTAKQHEEEVGLQHASMHDRERKPRERRAPMLVITGTRLDS